MGNTVGEGKTVTIILIGGFMLLAVLGAILIALGRLSTQEILAYYGGLGILAGMLGLKDIIQFWFDTRGQTTPEQPIEVLKSVEFNGTSVIPTDPANK